MARTFIYNDHEVPSDAFMIINGIFVYTTQGISLYHNLILLSSKAKNKDGHWLVDAEVTQTGIYLFTWNTGATTRIDETRLTDFYNTNWPSLITPDKAKTGDVPGLVVND